MCVTDTRDCQNVGHRGDVVIVWTEINNLRKHGEVGRLKYPTFRGLGLALGSGSIVSGIHRVINMRLKGNSIFWREEGAEAIMQIRAQVLANRLDERVAKPRQLRKTDARSDRAGCLRT